MLIKFENKCTNDFCSSTSQSFSFLFFSHPQKINTNEKQKQTKEMNATTREETIQFQFPSFNQLKHKLKHEHINSNVFLVIHFEPSGLFSFIPMVMIHLHRD